MTQKLSRKPILTIALACLLCLGIGIALGYGIRTQELRATAAAAGAENGDDLVGASRPIITGDEIFMARLKKPRTIKIRGFFMAKNKNY